MDEPKTIGLPELLDEITRDIDELRKKHPSDYGVKGTTMWWELEKERLLVRHSSVAVIKRLRRLKSLKYTMLLFLLGWFAAIALSAAVRILID